MADDDPSVLAVLGTVLAAVGVVLTGVTDPEHVWALLGETPPALIIVDLDMPDVNGIELCRRPDDRLYRAKAPGRQRVLPAGRQAGESVGPVHPISRRGNLGVRAGEEAPLTSLAVECSG